MTDIHNVYRIMVLYMLDHTQYPLTNTQITNFMLDRDYTDYFTIQQTLHDLQLSGLIVPENTFNNTRYLLTDAGKDSLQFFDDKLTPELKDDILLYFKEHDFELRKENEAVASYYKAPGNGYQVNLQLKQSSRPALELTMYVPTKDQAVTMCENWKDQTEEVYFTLLDLLVR